MASETITRNDLKAILDEALPNTSVDYIVEQGTNGIWTYRKWNSGLYDAWYIGTINLLAGTAWLNGAYFHMASSTLTPPSFSIAVTDLVGACNSGTLNMYAGHNENYQTYWVNGSSGTMDSVAVRLDMHGRWK